MCFLAVLAVFIAEEINQTALLILNAVGEEPPKEDSEYDETDMILKHHLRPNRPIEETSVRWVPKPGVYTLFHEPMALDFVVRHHV